MALILNFAALSPEDRENLLQGPTITLITKHNGTTVDRIHQLSAAQYIVAHDRYRQLEEQSNNTSRTCAIEYPVNALVAASPDFYQLIEASPDLTRIDLDMCGLLPGYLMEVLDWFVVALRANVWFDFLPEDPSTEDTDKFYWFYPYVAMRKLGMTAFADHLRPFIEKLVDEYGLADDAWTVEILLKHVSEHDPVLLHIAKRYAKLLTQKKMPLANKEYGNINIKFPHLGALVNELLSELLNEAMQTAMITEGGMGL